MQPQQIVKWISYVCAVIVLFLPMPLPIDKVALAVLLVLHAMFWQHEPHGAS